MAPDVWLGGRRRRGRAPVPLPPIAKAVYRRAILFMLAIGVPVCVGIVLRQPAGALLGGVCGLILSFSDDDRSLLRRYEILFMTACAIGLAGAAGFWLRGFPPPAWVLFIALTFGAGLANRIGKAPVMSARYAAMALIVTSGMPAFEFAEIYYPLGALVLVAVLRAADHALAGPLEQQRGGTRAAPPGGWTRFAAAYAGAATLSLWIGLAIDPHRVIWVVVTTLIVMQSDARSSYVRIVQRIAGTFAGVIAAFAITSVIHTQRAIAAVVLMVAPFIPHHLQNRYWLHTALIALLVLLIYDLATFNPQILHSLFTERLEDVVLGAGIALIGTVAAFPRKAPEDN